MSEHIRFGIEESIMNSRMNSRLFVDLPSGVLDKIMSDQQYERLVEKKGKKLKCPVVTDPNVGSADARLYVNTSLVGKMPDRAKQQHVLGKVARLVNFLGNYPETDVADPEVQVVLGGQTESASDRLPMYATVALDQTVDHVQLSSRATQQMQSIAASLRYIEPDLIQDMVGATVKRNRHISLTVNPLGSCTLDTDGVTFDPAADRIELYGHNLYSHSQQLTCLAGAVALAREPERKQTAS